MSIQSLGSYSSSDAAQLEAQKKQQTEALVKQLLQLLKTDPEAAAAMLSQLSPDMASAVMSQLEKSDPQSADKLGKVLQALQSSGSQSSGSGQSVGQTADTQPQIPLDQLIKLLNDASKQQQQGQSMLSDGSQSSSKPNVTLTA